MSANPIENSEAYRGDCLPSIIELVERSFERFAGASNASSTPANSAGAVSPSDSPLSRSLDADKDGISAADEVEPCEYCGGIDQCRYDCPAPTLTAEQAYNENVLRNEGGR